MIKNDIVVGNEMALESKLAAMFIQKASRFRSNIWIEKGHRKANAKSLLGLLSLSIARGAQITLIIEGEDEQVASNELEAFLTLGFVEGT